MFGDVTKISFGGETLILGRFRTLSDDEAEGEGDPLMWLRSAFGDPGVVARLRAYLSLHSLLRIGYKVDDHEVLAALQAALASGWLQARVSADPAQYRPIGDPKPAPKSAPAPSSAPPRQIQSQPPPPPEKDFAQEAAQAETLKKAGENGTPFCEICEKMKAERARAA